MGTAPLSREQLIERMIERLQQMPDEQVAAIAVLVEKLPTLPATQPRESATLHIVTVPFTNVRALYDLIQVGGDALEDSQSLYN
jgi:hypothetical protein